MKTYLPIENSGKELELEVYYSKGGQSMADYKTYPRGYYGRVTPVKITKHDGYTSIEFMMFSGIKTLLLEVKRQSPKAAAQAAELWKSRQAELIAHVLNQVKQDEIRKEQERQAFQG